MVLKLGHFGMWIRDTWKVLKCAVGEGRRIIVGPIVCEIKKYYLESNGKKYHTFNTKKEG